MDGVFWRPWLSLAYKMFNASFGGSVKFRADGKETFRDHQDEIRRLVPREKLLEYRVGEGWERLCEFLEVEVPNEQFPKINDGKDFKEMFGSLMKIRALALAKQATPFVVGLLALGGAV